MKFKSLSKFILFILITFALIFISNNVEAVSVNTKEVTLYVLDEHYNNDGIYLPSNLPTQFQLKVTGTNFLPEYELLDDAFIGLTVSDDGLIKTKKDTDGDYYAKDFDIKITVVNDVFYVKVHVIDYIDIYVDNIINEYLKENIKEGMTQYEKLEKICQFVGKYRYGGSPSYQGMIACGGGDCWGSSYCVIHLCEMLGMKARIRYAGNEPGSAGITHRNVAVLADGKIYKVEAGYNEPVPRHYTIEEVESGCIFSWDGQTNDLLISQYEGFDEDVVLPKTHTKNIAGEDIVETVKGIAPDSFANPVRCTEQ